MEYLIWLFVSILVALFVAVGGITTLFCWGVLACSRTSDVSLLATPFAGPGQFEESKRWLVGVRNRAYWTLLFCLLAFVLIVIVGGARGFEIGAP